MTLDYTTVGFSLEQLRRLRDGFVRYTPEDQIIYERLGRAIRRLEERTTWTPS